MQGAAQAISSLSGMLAFPSSPPWLATGSSQRVAEGCGLPHGAEAPDLRLDRGPLSSPAGRGGSLDWQAHTQGLAKVGTLGEVTWAVWPLTPHLRRGAHAEHSWGSGPGLVTGLGPGSQAESGTGI